MTAANIQHLNTREACVAADESDPLASFRDRFELPEGVIYLDGNSLGPRPKGALERATDVITREWGQDLIASWNTAGWFDLPVTIGKKIGRLLGNDPETGAGGSCVVTDTTSINLFKALGAAIHIQKERAPERKVIISERDNFPTDLYMTEGLIELLDQGYELKLIDDADELSHVMGNDTAIVLLTHVNYRTGYLWDIAGTTAAIQQAGALAIWDLCHSVGSVPVNLPAANVDFAIGCTYKYLNAGPGAPAFIWVADRHVPNAKQPLSGWWGHKKPFDMAASYEPADGDRRFLSGTQPIVSLSMVETGIDVHLDADMDAVRKKSLELTSLFIALVEERIPNHPLTLVTPREEEFRGSHVSIRHPEGFAVMKALIAEGVIGDYREPEVLRFGIAPLYVGYADIWDAVETLRRVLDEELWRQEAFQIRGAVT